MLECQNGLDKTSRTRRGFCVAYLGLHRAECASRRVIGEHRLECRKLGYIAGLGCGAMRFEKTNGRWRVSGTVVGQAERFRLPF